MNKHSKLNMDTKTNVHMHPNKNDNINSNTHMIMNVNNNKNMNCDTNANNNKGKGKGGKWPSVGGAPASGLTVPVLTSDFQFVFVDRTRNWGVTLPRRRLLRRHARNHHHCTEHRPALLIAHAQGQHAKFPSATHPANHNASRHVAAPTVLCIAAKPLASGLVPRDSGLRLGR